MAEAVRPNLFKSNELISNNETDQSLFEIDLIILHWL